MRKQREKEKDGRGDAARGDAMTGDETLYDGREEQEVGSEEHKMKRKSRRWEVSR